MTFFVAWATIYLFIALSKNEKHFDKNVFISYALISCICALGTLFFSRVIAMIIYIAGITLIFTIFIKKR